MAVPVIVIFAPTATGKTAIATKFFGKSSHSFFKGKAELISADSMQAYRGLDIGSAKPTVEERNELVHHLIDIHEINEQYTTAEFVEKAEYLCRDIFSCGKIPLVIGGTGFYIRNFLLGLPETPASNENLRNELKQKAKKLGLKSMFEELKKVDFESARKISENDEYRILRALEIFYLTGKPRSSFKQNNELKKDFDFTTIILERNRQDLYDRINLRVDQMFEIGLEEEVRNLIKNGAKKEMPAMQAIGYREWFEGDFSSREGVQKIREEIKHASRKYAKKQYTFMKGIPNAIKIDVFNEENALSQIEKIIEKIFEKNKLDINSVNS